MTACPTCAAKPSATKITPSEKRVEAEIGREAHRPAAAPPGLGPDVVRTATARGLTFRTSPQFVQVSMSAEPAEPAHRADHRELVAAALADGRVPDG